jgi:predicted Rossmann fold flavoprotein
MKKVIVIGGGPAGMMAAIRSAHIGNNVLLIEKNESLGKKLLLTGKGRCNITNDADLDRFLSAFSKNSEFLRDAFKKFFVKELIDFFEQRGLHLKVERQKRVFPCTDSSASILNVLKKEISVSGVRVLYNTKVSSIAVDGAKAKGVFLSTDKMLTADYVILATGGISYGFTGSTGDGHNMALKTGHTITQLVPGLVSLKVKEAYIDSLEGLSLKNIQLSFTSNNKKIKSKIGELLFTDTGISGPLVISMSAGLVSLYNKNKSLVLHIDLKPGLDTKHLDMRFLREIKTAPKKTIFNLLKTMLPLRIIALSLKLADISRDKKVSEITSLERKNLVSLIKSWQFHITGPGGMEKAMVTRGGVSLKDIDPKTMQSRIIKGLYFAGELIDVDADTGGFNLQAAFSTGYLAGGCHGN